MATINIRRDVKDPFYRYKMPKLEAKIEGKGNGIKTVVPNMTNIARALTRPPIYPTKYFGIELGAQVSCEEKNSRFIVNGAHDAAKLQELLDGFIDKFVLCGACKNPETKLIVSKRDIQRKCGACGKRTPVIPTHRLTTYILKNPPSKDETTGQHATASTPGVANGGDEAQDALTQQITSMAAEMDINSDKEAADEWMADLDTSAEAIARRQKQLAGGLSTSLDDEEDSGDAYSQLANYITEENPKDLEIFNKAKELGIQKKSRALRSVIQSLFTDTASSEIVGMIEKHAKLLISFGTDAKHQKATIDTFVTVISENDSLLEKTPIIFKALYDEEIVEEEAFIAWGEKPSKKHVDREMLKKIHGHAIPFLTWLEEADEESDEDSDDE